MDFKWIKQHPLSACSVGDVETIEDEERIAELKEGKYITPYDPTKDEAEEVDPIKELEAAEEKYQSMVDIFKELESKYVTLNNENAALKAEIETLKAAPVVATKTK